MATAAQDTLPEETLVRVMYVGKKPFAADNVAGSGATWTGRGDVQEVTLDQAKILYGFPDSWWPEGKLPTSEEVTKNLEDFYASGKIPDTVVLPKSTKVMDLLELRRYVERTFGQKLKARTLKAGLEELAFLEEEAESHHPIINTTAAKVTGRRAGARAAAKPAAKSAKKR